MNSDSDYNAAGFDNFLSRSVDSPPGANLDSQSKASYQVAFDRNQITGALGDTYRMGSTYMNNSNMLVRDDNSVRVLIGEQSDGTQGITVSKEGFDADINTPSNLIFNSNQNVFKIVYSNTVTVTQSGSSTEKRVEIPHNLGFIPMLLYNVQPDVGYTDHSWRAGPHIFVNQASGVLDSSTILGVDSTNVIIRYTTPGLGAFFGVQSSVNIKYYLLQETSN